MNNRPVSIKEHSWLAKIAAAKLKTSHVAMVLGSTIHLHNTTEKEFLQSRRWLQHELCHVRQFQQYGFWPFLMLYLWESLRKGYYNNRFEAAARAAEEL